ncbi:uncharacterized protein LODBEIA_P56070 [Lodderomyces beijingensis]|uniref:EF-hand domain-containing protein n=1 Tax=Lodderomyces beijingensis TaxID=1775926 RepID=A0ABP0ZTC2_9ASCO
MSYLSSVSAAKRTQIKNAFTLIDGESRDSNITLEDLKQVYTTVGLARPSDSELKAMMTIDGVDHSETGIKFAQFSAMMAKEMSQLEEASLLYTALQAYSLSDDQKVAKDDLQIDMEKLKDACCSANVGAFGEEPKYLSRQSFNKLTKGFVSENIDGKPIFLASKWLDAYLN